MGKGNTYLMDRNRVYTKVNVNGDNTGMVNMRHIGDMYMLLDRLKHNNNRFFRISPILSTIR